MLMHCPEMDKCIVSYTLETQKFCSQRETNKDREETSGTTIAAENV